MKHTVVQKPLADRLREDFIETFTDKTLPFYQKTLRMHQYFDGMCYAGYIWEVLKKPYEITTREAALALLEGIETVYVLWDIRTMKNVARAFHYKVPKDQVIQTEGGLLAEQLRSDFEPMPANPSFLPEDIYVFDDSLDWYIAFTHETDDNGRPMCLARSHNQDTM